GRLAQLRHSGGYRLACLSGLIAEVGERRDRLGRGIVFRRCRPALAAGGPHVEARNGKGWRPVLELGNHALGELLADTRRLLDRGPVLQGDRVREVLRRERAEHGQRHLGSYALDRLQGAEPGTLHLAGEPEQADGVLAHVRLDGKAYRLTR